MTSKELFSRIASLESDLTKNQYLFDAIRMMSDRQIEVIQLHSNALLAADLHPTHNAVNSVRSRLREIIDEVRKLSPKKIFAEINSITVSLTQLESSLNTDAFKKLQVMKQEIEAFSEAYENLVTTYQLLFNF